MMKLFGQILKTLFDVLEENYVAVSILCDKNLNVSGDECLNTVETVSR